MEALRKNLTLIFLILLLLIISISQIQSIFFKYKSAFEADQACHHEKWELYGEDKSAGCDHDLETRKWILFEEGSNHMPAKVIKRFIY